MKVTSLLFALASIAIVECDAQSFSKSERGPRPRSSLVVCARPHRRLLALLTEFHWGVRRLRE